MKSRSWIGLLLIGLVLLAALAACSSAPQPARQLKFSVGHSVDSSWFKGASKFADLVSERTRGRLIITVYPDGQLAGGDQTKELQMLGNGQIDFTYHSTLFYSNLEPRFAVVSLPWVFNDYATLDKFLAGPAAKLLGDLTPSHGITTLAFGENGFRQITNSKREIKTPNDLNGLKVRVPSAKLYTSVFRAFGADTASINLVGVYKALQENVVDGQENPLDVIVSSKFYSVQRFVTLWNYSYDALVLGVNKDMFNGLDKQTQDIVRQAAIEASAYQIKENRDAAKTQVELLKSKGMTVTELTTEQIKPFRELMAPVYQEYEPIIGPELMAQIQALGK